MEINSPTNERIKNWAKLQQKKYRDQSGQFLIEGEHLIGEALQAGVVEHLLMEAGRINPFASQCEAIVCSEIVMRKLSTNVSGAWLIAVCSQKSVPAQSGLRTVVLDGVQDPGNVGTIIRTAVAFGFDQVLLSPDCADVYNEKCVRSTQGALFHIAIQRTELLEALGALKEAGVMVIGTALHKAQPLAQLPVVEKVAIVLGNEGQGVRPETLEICDQRALIEMFSFESLNVAVAAGICLYRYRREA